MMDMLRFVVCPLLVFLSNLPSSGPKWKDGSVPRDLKPLGDSYTRFDNGQITIDQKSSSLNVTALTGKQAILVCVVKNIGNESISWIRHRDTSLLAVNRFVYKNSHRFKVHHQTGSPEWRLSIQPVHLNDTGWYSCQISVTPHLEHKAYLYVIQPSTKILGPKERYIEEGSTINITCIIEAGPSTLNPSFVFWNYNGKIITYDRQKGGTVMISERGKQTTSSLIITHATQEDSGIYECDPSVSYTQSVKVHVIKIGEGTDAIRKSGVDRILVQPLCLLAVLALSLSWFTGPTTFTTWGM